MNITCTTTFYGPHECDECEQKIVRSSHESGGIKFDMPDGPVYPNTKWQTHRCSHSKVSLPSTPATPEEVSARQLLKEFLEEHPRPTGSKALHRDYSTTMSCYDLSTLHDAAERLGLNCSLPPEGWYCTRIGGHEGPCAARPIGGSA